MKSFFRIFTIFFLTKSHMEVLDSNYMAVNIEMNYYDGNSYVALRPKGDFGNMEGNLTVNQMPNNMIKKEIITYTGTGAGEFKVSTTSTCPCFIIGGRMDGMVSNYSFAIINKPNHTIRMNGIYLIGNSTYNYRFSMWSFYVDIYTNKSLLEFATQCDKSLEVTYPPSGNTQSNPISFAPSQAGLDFFNRSGVTYQYLLLC